jgi:uncharacterized membrane protein YfcA
MTREHRWHAIERILIACGIAAIIGNFYYYLREGEQFSLFVACLVTAMLLLFLWRRPRARGNQVIDAVIRRIRKEN